MHDDDPVALEHRGWQALGTGGETARAFYDRVLDERVLMLLPGGLVLSDRLATLEAMAGAPWSRYDLDGVRCLPLTPDAVAVAYGVEAWRGSRPYSALVGSLYVRRAEGWRLAVHQQTPR